jgi:hypothetical protein
MPSFATAKHQSDGVDNWAPACPERDESRYPM